MADKLLWKPENAQKWFLTCFCFGLVSLIACLHYVTGLAYEFNSFYAIPILASAWLLDTAACAALTVACLAAWAIADIQLGGEQSDLLPLAVNTTTRAFTIILVIVTMKRLRRALQREWDISRQDQLSGLWNRRYFFELGATILTLAKRQSLPVTMVFMDLDRFKEVNDSLGHAVGDELLRTVSAVMQAHFRSEDVLARLGGDEFAAIMPGLTAADARLRLESLRDKIRTTMDQQGWPVTLSIGAASFVVVEGSIEAMVRAAHAAMYEAKAAGRDRLVLHAYPPVQAS